MSDSSNFDDKLRNKLESIEPSLPENAWDLFEQKQAEPFDDAMKSKLDAINPTYSEGSWIKLAAALDKEKRKPILWLAGIAASLLFVLVYNLNTGSNIDVTNNKVAVAISEGKQDAGLSSQRNQNSNTGTQEANNSIEASRNAPKASPTPAVVSPNNIRSQVEQPTSTVASTVGDQGSANNTTEQAATNNGGLDKAISSQNVLISTPDLTKIFTSFASIEQPLNTVLSDNLTSILHAAPSVESENSVLSKLDELETPLLVQPFDAVALPPGRSSNWKAGIFASVDNNLALTPQIEDLDLDPFENLGLGFSGGFSLIYDQPKWFIETGLVVSSNRYEPKPIEEISGDVNSGYRLNTVKRVELNVVKIPVNFMYKFVRSERLQIYSVTGASLNVAFTANYFRQTQYFGDPTIRTFDAAPNSVIESVPYSNGWLEGGAFAENRYLSLNAGFGIQYKINDQFEIYSQPVFQYGFTKNGIGPIADRYHSMSLMIGTRLSLGH